MLCPTVEAASWYSIRTLTAGTVSLEVSRESIQIRSSCPQIIALNYSRDDFPPVVLGIDSPFQGWKCHTARAGVIRTWLTLTSHGVKHLPLL